MRILRDGLFSFFLTGAKLWYDEIIKPNHMVNQSKRSNYVYEQRRSGTVTFSLVVLILLLITVAGGVMFFRKSGLATLFGSNQAPATNTAPQAPATVSKTVVVSVAAVQGGEFPNVTSRVIETDVKATDVFTATGTATTSSSRATGTATIINGTSRGYTFVATTRLLSKEGVLFRMKSTTPIPANGSVDVTVYADQTGPGGDIGPTTFTIPGLSAALQSVITAKSDAAMTGGDGHAKAVSADDIANAKAALQEKLKGEAQANFAAMLSDGEKLLPDLMAATELAASAPAVGTAGATFTMTLSLRYHALVLPEKAILPLLDDALVKTCPQGLNASNFKVGAPLYTVQAYDAAGQTAEVRAEAPVNPL